MPVGVSDLSCVGYVICDVSVSSNGCADVLHMVLMFASVVINWWAD